jgi:hypothetical protein
VSEQCFYPAATPLQQMRILQATYNVALWLVEQLDSIANQKGVRVSIVAS